MRWRYNHESVQCTLTLAMNILWSINLIAEGTRNRGGAEIFVEIFLSVELYIIIERFDALKFRLFLNDYSISEIC